MSRPQDGSYPEPADDLFEFDASAEDEDLDDGDDLGEGAGGTSFSLRAPIGDFSPESSVRISWWSIAKVAAIGLGEAAGIIATALLTRAAIDRLVEAPGSRSDFAFLVGGLAAVALFAAWVRSMEYSVSEGIGYRFVERLRMVMYAHMQRTTSREMLNNSRGGTLLRFTGDLSTVRTWVSRGIARGMVAVITLVAALALLAFLDPFMAPVAAGILLVGAGLSLAEGAEVRKATRQARRQRSNLTTNVSEQIASLAVVQSMGRTSGEFGRFSRQNARLTRVLLRYARVRGWLRAVSTASGSLAVVGVLVVGIFDVSSGSTSIGAVVAAMSVARQMVRPVRTLGLSHDYWQSAKVSREKIIRFLQRPYREADGVEREKLLVGGGRIEFQDVHLEGSLRGVTAEVKARQIVAIIGPNGAGKSSLLSVVARIADPDAGQVVVDGQVLSECSLRSCSARISMVGPALPLMRGSLRRNLTYRWPSAPDAELERVIEIAGVEDVVAALPGGLDGLIKEGGASLSAGEASRVALARALVGNPKILLLDEPTAHLDESARLRVREAVMRYGGTVLLATHDSADAALADVVWRMEQGRIAEVIPGTTYRAQLATSPALPEWALAADRR